MGAGKNTEEKLYSATLYNNLTSASLSILQVIVTLTLSALLFRYLTIENFGVWASATAAISMLTIVAQMGLPDLLIRETATTTAKPRDTKIWSKWSAFDKMIYPSLGASLLLSCAVLPLLPGLPWRSITGAAILLHIPIIAFIALRAGAIRGIGLGNTAHFLTTILAPILTIAVVWSLTTMGYAITLTAAFMASLFSLGVPLLLTHVLREKLLPRPTDIAPLRSRLRRALRRASLPMAGIAGLGILNSQTDLLMLSWIDGPESAAIYQISIQAALVLTLIRSQLGFLMSPRVSRLWKERDRDGISDASRTVALTSLFFSAVAFITTFVCGELILIALFGPGAETAAPIFTIICGAWTVASLFGIPGFCLIMANRAGDTLRASAISFAINALLNPIAIPMLGVWGAAITLLVSVSYWHISLWLKAHRVLGINTAAFSCFGLLLKRINTKA